MGIWFKSGQSVRRVFLYEPALSQRDLKMEALFVPVMGRTGRILLGYLPGSDSDPKLTALSIFLHFLANPENIRLGGPCPLPEKYFYWKILRGFRVLAQGNTVGHPEGGHSRLVGPLFLSA